MSEGEQIPAAPPRKSKAKKLFFLFVFVIVLAIATAFGWYRYRFPYGWSHCCDIQLGFALQTYAGDHGGRFPSGAGSPEASLSLLYSNYADANLLRGKTIPLGTVENAFATNGKLGPESCGWHYVEGLTLSDDPRIAIIWDKIGLGHNGERLSGHGHSVVLVDGSRTSISTEAWPKFLQDQKELLTHRSKEAIEALPALIASIRLPTGEVLTNYDGPYDLKTIETSDGFSGEGTESGSNFELTRYRVTPDQGQITWVLTLPDQKLRSKPITLKVEDGRASPRTIIFEMQRD